MTNRELIEKLQKLPQDAEVYFEYGDYSCWHRVSAAAVTNEKDENIIVIE